MKCPSCNGNGETLVFRDYADGTGDCVVKPCDTCHGRREISDADNARIQAGKAFRKARIERRENLLACAARLGVTPAMVSAVERGRVEMPEEWEEP